ncbi:MAG: hypothetical protein R3B13_19090 [Polyangiaceae bacterium]
MKTRSLALALVFLALLACKSDPKPGASCKNEGEASCQGKSTILTCRSGKWEEVACKGPEGCAAQGAIVKCDETLAQEGDPCGNPEGDHYSCSVDKTHELKCEASKWKMIGKCGGPKGCAPGAVMIDCDNSVATIGDLCGKDEDAACSKDKKAILVCQGGKFKESQKCEDDTSCKAEGLFVKCE